MWNSLSRGSPASGDTWKWTQEPPSFCHNNWCAINHKDFVMGNVGKLSVNFILTVFTNLTPDVYTWTCTIWRTSFAASHKWSGNSEQVFINQLNFRPTSIGKHNSMGYLLPCAIDVKTNNPPTHLQWFGKLGVSAGSRHVISMGSRQPEVPGEAIVVCGASWHVKDSISRCMVATLFWCETTTLSP